MIYMNWYQKNHTRAKRLNTYESLWKFLRQLYYDKTQSKVPEIVGKQVTDYIHGDFCTKFSLIRGIKQKFCVGHNTLLGMLHYHWKFDTSIFPCERERVQLATILLFLAYTGARPGAIVESTSGGIKGSNESLLYKDLKLKLLQPLGSAPLLVLEITIRLDKGKRKRASPKTITLYENSECPAMCPIVHFLALAFADNAFHPQLVAAGLCAEDMHRFRNPEGRITIDFKFKDDILEVPLFRAYQRSFDGISVHPTKALPAQTLNEESKRLGQRAGLPHSFQPYCLRREVGTELTDRGVSDQQRNQIMGHARSETFLKHYISSSVIVDVQATFLGQTSRSDLIKEVGKLTLRRDPNLPKALTPQQKKKAHQAEDLVAAEQRRDVLGAALRQEFGHINKAPPEHVLSIERKEVMRTITTLKIRYEREAFQRFLRDFHTNADLQHMVGQLRGEEAVTASALKPVQHAHKERNELACRLFEPADGPAFAFVVNYVSSRRKGGAKVFLY